MLLRPLLTVKGKSLVKVKLKDLIQAQEVQASLI